MHIPDGFLAPEVCAAAGAASIAAVGWSVIRLRDQIAERTVALTGMTAAFIFAGQMVNFRVPIAFLGVPAVSGHLMGGVLAAVLLGPWAGCIAVTIVVAMQALLFSDGGLLAMGANVLNMAVIGTWGGYGVYTIVRRLIRDRAVGTVVGAVVASWLTVMAAAMLFCLELGFSVDRTEFDLGRVFSMMVSVHSLIGIGEALITGGIVSFALTQRPDLLERDEPTFRPHSSFTQIVMAGLVVAMTVAAFLAPFASSAPDGLEAVAESRGFIDQADDGPGFVLSDYAIPSPFAGWNRSPWWQRVSVSLAGMLGTLTVAVAAFLFARSIRSRMQLEAESVGSQSESRSA
ncbi:energy-coupling factor ABC transporter permease [Thalassoroseus pseudoceratinae]|uniref:energy-coupling factor ABC transporter permease n=1 Tax=Thalassoroseus pseudoceratinae TaxID=2713176 RepID=UPI0014206A01|nr:energy-coupling factor ABC transporter permease [Thalassoroseus pseudoceratinae]